MNCCRKYPNGEFFCQTDDPDGQRSCDWFGETDDPARPFCRWNYEPPRHGIQDEYPDIRCYNDDAHDAAKEGDAN